MVEPEAMDPMSEARGGFEALYRATTYRVEAPGGAIAIRIGNRCPDLDALLTALGAAEWAFITAWNPGSQMRTPAENAAAHRALIHIVQERGHRFHEGDGIPDGPGWVPERSLWIAGIDRAEAVELGRRFGQNAIVAGSVGEAAELVLCICATGAI